MFQQILKLATLEKKINETLEKSLVWSYYGHLWLHADHNLMIYGTQANHIKVK